MVINPTKHIIILIILKHNFNHVISTIHWVIMTTCVVCDDRNVETSNHDYEIQDLTVYVKRND